jgi:sugar-specific transcriptional regulator TrmB
MDTKPLEEIGLTKGESKVYLALLELGPSTTGDIIKLAGVSRSKVYEMLEKLIKLGLVSFVVRENTRYYEAASPQRLAELLAKRRESLGKQQRQMEELVALLKRRRGLRKHPQMASVYEGVEGIRTIYNSVLEILKPGDEYFAVQVEPEAFTEDFVRFIRNYHKRRAKRGLKVKLLANYEMRQKTIESLQGLKGMEIRFTGRPLPAATLAFADRVFTFVWEPNPIGFVIQSKQIAGRYKKFLTYLWNTAKK